MSSVKRRVADVHFLSAGRVVGIAGVVALGVLLYATHGSQFYLDEWDFVYRANPNIGTYFFPHNGHWSTMSRLVYSALLDLFSLRTHLPEEIVMLSQHIVAAILLFRIVRRRSSDLFGIGAAALFLMFGSGSFDIVVCCAGGDAASLLFGLLAIDLLDARRGFTWRLPAAAVALLVSLACSGFGLAFVAAALVQILLEPSRGSRLAAMSLPIAGYVVWFLMVGRHYTGAVLSLSPSHLWLLARYVGYGLAATGAAVFGVDSHVGVGHIRTEIGGWPAFASLAIVLGIAVFGAWRRLDGKHLGALAGIIVLFVAAGLVRINGGIQEAGANRYMYVAFPFLALLVVAALGRLRSSSRAGALFACLVIVGMIGNLFAFHTVGEYFKGQLAAERIVVQTLNDVRGAPDLNREAIFPATNFGSAGIIVGSQLVAESRFGSPVPPSSLHALASDYPRIVDFVFRIVLASELRMDPAPDSRLCSNLAANDFTVASAGSRVIGVIGDGRLHVELGWAATPVTVRNIRVHSGAWSIGVPNIGRNGFAWHVILRSSTVRAWAC